MACRVWSWMEGSAPVFLFVGMNVDDEGLAADNDDRRCFQDYVSDSRRAMLIE